MTETIPDIDALKRLDGAGFARVVCNSLGRHGMKTPGFNLAANAETLLPPLGKMFFYPAEAHGLISSGLKALREFDRQIEYIRNHPEIRDVLLSGGDPLLFSDDKLDQLLGRLRAIPSWMPKPMRNWTDEGKRPRSRTTSVTASPRN